MGNYTKSAIKGAFIVFILTIIAAFFGYLIRFILATNLTVEDFGLFCAILAFFGILGFFKSLGFDRALTKFIPEFRHKKQNNLIKSSIIAISFLQLATNTIIIFLVYYSSNYLSTHFFHNPQSDIIIRLLAIGFFLDSFVLVLKCTFQGFKKMVYFSGIDLSRMFIILALLLLGLKLLGNSLFSPVLAYILAPFIILIIFSLILFKIVFPEFAKSQFTFKKIPLKKISNYSLFVMATTAGAMILGYTDTMVLTYFSGLKDVGLYNVALPTAKILTYIPMAIGGILLPLTSELWAKKKKVLLKEGMELLYKYSIIILIPLVCIMFSFTDLMIIVLFGKKYILASNALKILSIGMIFENLYLINSNFFLGIGKPEVTSKIVYAAASFNLISNLILVPLIGILGAAITTTLSFFIMMVVGLTKIRKFINIKMPSKIWFTNLLVGILFVGIIAFLKRIISVNIWLESSIILTTSLLIYAFLLKKLKVIDIKEIKNIIKLLKDN